MSDDTGTDPYAAVLADIDAQIERLRIAKDAIQAIRGNRATVSESSMSAPPTSGGESGVIDTGAFLGMTITDATKKLLGIRRKAMNNPAISAELKAGGLVLQSSDPINTIGAVLTRRSKDVGDIVRVARGTWGLREWYPHTSFKRKDETSPKEEAAPTPSVSEPPETNQEAS